MVQQVNLPACSPHCPFNAERSREATNINFIVIGSTRLEIKLKSTAPKADALTTRPSELFNMCSTQRHYFATTLRLFVFFCKLILILTEPLFQPRGTPGVRGNSV